MPAGQTAKEKQYISGSVRDLVPEKVEKQLRNILMSTRPPHVLAHICYMFACTYTHTISTDELNNMPVVLMICEK